MSLEEINIFLESSKKQLNAASCTFYINDPIWSDELRLIAMPGVKLTEPMHGFSFSLNTERSLDQDELEIFETNVKSSRIPYASNENIFDQIDIKKQFLFGNFIKREGIKSSARLIYKADDQVQAVFFVNYNEKTKFDNKLKKEIRTIFNKLVDDLPALREEILAIESQNITQIMHIFSPLRNELVKPGNEWNHPWEHYLHTLLHILEKNIPEISNDNGFATIHLFDKENKTLQIIARSKNLDQTQFFPPLSVNEGQGVISWVALHKKALLINDLEMSLFKVIHSPVKEGVKSEIAIPIIAENELIGVLNLESMIPDAFSSIYVRTLWYAVGQAVMTFKLSQQEDLNKRLRNLNSGLLEICEEWVANNLGDFSLDRLAELAMEQLNASRCEILRYDSKKDSFELAGKSCLDLPYDLPRKNGMTYSILRYKCPIWLNAIKDQQQFSIYCWDGGVWTDELKDKNFPETLNVSVIEHGVQALLGIPFLVRGKCSGIAWLEYNQNKNMPPSEEFMKLANGFAAHAGLGIEFSRVDLIDKDAVQSIGETLSQNLLATGRLNFDGFDKIEGYVKSQPCSNSSIGGDFFAARVIDSKTAGVLLGDGQGHAVNGALNMIPMLTVFETFWKESRSVTHIMDKIMDMSNKLGVRGTAFYCVFSIIGDNLWLSVTSAGHDPLIIISENGNPAELFPLKDSPAIGPMLGLSLLQSPLVEDHRKLSAGDIVILFTDGLNLSPNEVSRIGLRHEKDDLSEIAEAVFNKAIEKNSPEPLDDDATVLIIRVLK